MPRPFDQGLVDPELLGQLSDRRREAVATAHGAEATARLLQQEE
jgi:hypothetical protein